MTSVADWWAEKGLHYRRSLASRVALLTTASLGLALALVSVGGYLTVRNQMSTSLDTSLLSRAKLAAKTPTLSQITADYAVPSWALGAADVRIFFISEQGSIRSADRGPELPLDDPEFAVAAGVEPESLRTITAPETGVPFRVAAVPTTDGQAMVVAQSLGPQDRALRRLGQSLFLAGGVGVLVSALAGWAVARNGLRPVRRLTLAVENAARTERLTPVPAEGDDEVGRLGAAFNSLIATVEASRARQRQLVADAGHELRTPLTSLRTNLDLLAMADADGGLPVDARAELIEDVRAQIEELSTLVGDLVELARDDPPGAEVETVDLADVAERAVARVRRRAPSVTFETELDSWPVTVEEHAVERALTNLLDNAAKWSPDGGTVTMRIAGGVLTVDDEGPGIPADDLPHVFDRFYRASESRGMPGSGLGLSIVRQVAERHGGSVDAEPSPAGGARLSLRLPRAKG